MAVRPTEDTPLSYQARCGGCESVIGMSFNYCPHCGEEIAWPGDDDDDPACGPTGLLTGGGR